MCKRHHSVNSITKHHLKNYCHLGTKWVRFTKKPNTTCYISSQLSGLCNLDRLSNTLPVCTLYVIGAAVCASTFVYRGTAAENIHPSLPFQWDVKSKCRLQSGTMSSWKLNQLQFHQWKKKGFCTSILGVNKHYQKFSLIYTHSSSMLKLIRLTLLNGGWTEQSSAPPHSRTAANNRSHLQTLVLFKVDQKSNPMGLADVTEA